MNIAGKYRLRLQHRMAGPELFGLFGNGYLAAAYLHSLPHVRTLVPHDEGDALLTEPAGDIDDIEHHRFAGHGMQHLGQFGFHPFAEPGRHDDHAESGNRRLRGLIK